MKFRHIKKGDTVRRMLAGTIPHDLIVTEVTDRTIICGWWEFDRETGVEIDDYFPAPPSYLVHTS